MEYDLQSNEYLSLNTAGVAYVTWNSLTVREEGRQDYQVIYVHEGRICAEVDGVEQMIPEGNVILYRPHERQKYSYSSDCPSLHCWIHFSGTACDKILAQAGFADTHVLHIGKNKQLVDVIRKLETEFRLQKEGYHLLCQGYLIEFFALLIRTLHYRNDPAALRNTALVKDVCSLIHQKLGKRLPLSFYADYCNLSVSRFSHIFKEIAGVSPQEYIGNARVENAASMLESTYLTIAEIAEKTGYYDQNHFAKAFKKKTGFTPKEYRSRVR